VAARERNLFLSHSSNISTFATSAPFEKNMKQSKLEHLAKEREHQVISLPPYHCQYDPIELAWAQVKRKITKKEKTFNISTVERLAAKILTS
jgi:transposase